MYAILPGVMPNHSYTSLVGRGNCCKIRTLLKLPRQNMVLMNTCKVCCIICTYSVAWWSLSPRINAIECVMSQLSTNTGYLSVVAINTLTPLWYLCGRDAYTVCRGVRISRCVYVSSGSTRINAIFIVCQRA